VGHVVPAHPLLAEGAAAEGEQRPFLDRQHAGGVRPVLEAFPAPQRRLDGVAPDRPQARVEDELVRAREHRDRVELDGAEPAQHGWHARAAVGGTEQALRAQGHAPRLVGAQLQDGLGYGGGRHGPGS
jgi:hypothetical protein